MSARSMLADALGTALGSSWRVVSSDTVGTVTRPTVLVYREQVAPGDGSRLRTHTFVVVVITPKQVDPDDTLDGLLDTVLDALDASTVPVAWTSAERSVYDDTYPAYKITTTMTTRDEA